MPTNSPPPGLTVDVHSPVRTAAQRLRNTLRLNAVTSFAGGLVALVAAGPLNDVFATSSPGWVRAVGAGLMLFALDVAYLAGRSITRLARYTATVIMADALWIVASAGAMIAGWFSTAGNVIVGSVAAMVSVFAGRQFMTLARLKDVTRGADAEVLAECCDAL